MQAPLQLWRTWSLFDRGMPHFTERIEMVVLSHGTSEIVQLV